MSKDLAIQAIREKLEAIARRCKTRGDFNKAAMKEFPKVGEGSYRVALDAGDYVIKLRLTDKEGAWSPCMMEPCNAVERQNWMALTNEFQFFVLEPTYIVLPNDHDAVIMPKVAVFNAAHMSWCDFRSTYFSPLMNEQWVFIRNAFADSHEHNIGWSVAEQRVWLIDYNHGAHFERRGDEVSTSAKDIIKKVSQSGERKAA
jgi:hypothetical protein